MATQGHASCVCKVYDVCRLARLRLLGGAASRFGGSWRCLPGTARSCCRCSLLGIARPRRFARWLCHRPGARPAELLPAGGQLLPGAWEFPLLALACASLSTNGQVVELHQVLDMLHRILDTALQPVRDRRYRGTRT